MMRIIADHKVGKVNELLTVEATDEPAGDAHHHYVVSRTVGDHTGKMADIHFHKGLCDDSNPVNGITDEVLLCVVADRLRDWQKGKMSCRENAIALTHIDEALLWLQKRTRERVRRGVEGTNTP